LDAVAFLAPSLSFIILKPEADTSLESEFEEDGSSGFCFID
jgi:hypothetical protein